MSDAIKHMMQDYGVDLKAAARQLAMMDTVDKNAALTAAAEAIGDHRVAIIEANGKDVATGKERGLADALVDRLTLTDDRIDGIINSLHDIVALPDPVGELLEETVRPNGLKIHKRRVPLGVIGVIYESRPNVTVDAAALCVKSGNAVLLRGGSEAVNSNRALKSAFSEGLTLAGMPSGAARLVNTTDRAAVGEMLTNPDLLDVVVPRGGKSLVARVQSEARVPVFAHLDGICHLYIHPAANKTKAIDVVVNAKMRRPGICGALETLLIDAKAIDQAQGLVKALQAAGCEVRGDQTICALADGVTPATDADWATEYLAPIISVAVVNGMESALSHLTRYSSHHTDGIITEDKAAAERFLNEVDSAIVMHNASTQFADGGEFGMGAEIGIATGRFHARGPVGLKELTTYKYQVHGTGQTRP